MKSSHKHTYIRRQTLKYCFLNIFVYVLCADSLICIAIFNESLNINCDRFTTIVCINYHAIHGYTFLDIIEPLVKDEKKTNKHLKLIKTDLALMTIFFVYIPATIFSIFSDKFQQDIFILQ